MDKLTRRKFIGALLALPAAAAIGLNAKEKSKPQLPSYFAYRAGWTVRFRVSRGSAGEITSIKAV